MAEIYPFRAVHYNPAKVPDLGKVVTQPYDKITPEMQARYYRLSPYNLVRIIRGQQRPEDSPQDNVYSRAARFFQDWVSQGILKSESEPALYAYNQEYGMPGAFEPQMLRRGFIALCRLEDYSAGVVLRHEETLSGPKADRLELLKATRAHFGQVFVLYSDPEGKIEAALAPASSGRAWQEVTDEYATRHAVWRITDPLTIEQVVMAMRDKRLVIADGHHRYETALVYRDLCRSQSLPDDRAEYIMMTFVRKESEGLTILPTHRVVHSLPRFDWREFIAAAEGFFEVKEVSMEPALGEWIRPFLITLTDSGRGRPSLGAYGGPGKLALLRLRTGVESGSALADLPASLRRLDVVLLHRLLLEGVLAIDRQAVVQEKHLRYVREIDVAIQEVESGKAELCFLTNPTPVEAVWENALAGQVLPQKSTDFFPKLLSGLTIYWLDNPAGL